MKKLLPADIRHPWVLFANGLGDHFLALPAIRALAGVFEGRLSLICGGWGERNLFSGVPFARVVEARFGFTEAGEKEFDAPEVAGRVGPCDLLIHVSCWDGAALRQLHALLHPAPLLGFTPGATIRLAEGPGRHVADLKFELARYFDPALRLEDFSGPPRMDPGLTARMRDFRRSLGPGVGVLAAQLYTKEDKMWGSRGWQALFDGLLARYPQLLVVCVGGGQHLYPFDASPYRDRIRWFGGGKAFEASCALVGHADFFVGVDSVFLHVADLFRVPSVGIFGPTPSWLFGCRFTEHYHIVAGNGPVASLDAGEVSGPLTRLLAEHWPAPRTVLQATPAQAGQ